MGHVYAEVKIAGPKRERIIERRMLVDTGATYTCLPTKLAEELNLPLLMEVSIKLADDREVMATYSVAYIEVAGRGFPCRAVIFDVSEPLIGVDTLEALGLAVDPVSGELKPTRGFIARA